ncbi:hypothetical protein TA3x_003662 [Tundrisphaera sp. TA3]|uniref:hypothetical protein n=1 Tax=Tundrisphaera sp. TA3 TaxID=3435775 RepID=UPI003EB7914D
MASALGSIALMIAISSTGGGLFRSTYPENTLPPGPGLGWGFANGNPDGYGWVDYGTALPIASGRNPDYYFPRYFAQPPTQMFLPSYYNPYLTRGQRFIPYTGCGGPHPASGPPMVSAATPYQPYQETLNNTMRTQVPAFNGRVEATPVNPGTTGLRP